MHRIEVIILRCDMSYEVKSVENTEQALGKEIGGPLEAILNHNHELAAYRSVSARMHGSVESQWTKFMSYRGYKISCGSPILGDILLCRIDEIGHHHSVSSTVKKNIADWRRLWTELDNWHNSIDVGASVTDAFIC